MDNKKLRYVTVSFAALILLTGSFILPFGGEALGAGDHEDVHEEAEFEIKRWKIDPVEVEPNQEIEIEVEVKNTGDASGELTLDLLIDDELEDWWTGPLDVGGSTRMDFTVSREEEGEYEITLQTQDHEVTETFEVFRTVSPLDIRMAADYREWIYDGETLKVKVEVHNQLTEELHGVKVVGEGIRDYGIGTLGPDEIKTLEVRITPDNYEAGEKNELTLRAEHDHGSSSITINFRVLYDTAPVEVFLASTNSPVYEMEKLEFSLVVAAAQGSGVEDLVVRALSENVTPSGYWVGEEMKEVEDIDGIGDFDELFPLTGTGDFLPGYEEYEGSERVIIGRKLIFEMINTVEDQGPIEFEIAYELGDRSMEKRFEVDYDVKDSDTVSLIRSGPVQGVEGKTVTVSLEITNEKDIDVDGVKIIPPDNVDIYPSPSYWVGPMDSNEFLPVEFRLDPDSVEDGDVLEFYPEYRIGEGRMVGSPVEVTVHLSEPERDISTSHYLLGLIVIIVVAGVIVYWRKR